MEQHRGRELAGGLELFPFRASLLSLRSYLFPSALLLFLGGGSPEVGGLPRLGSGVASAGRR